MGDAGTAKGPGYRLGVDEGVRQAQLILQSSTCCIAYDSRERSPMFVYSHPKVKQSARRFYQQVTARALVLKMASSKLASS